MKRYILIASLLFLSLGKVAVAADNIEIIRQRVIDDLMKPYVNDAHVKQLMCSIREDGTWPTINYVDVSRTGFQHGQHLNNLVELSRAFKKEAYELKGDQKLIKVIYSALDYWLANDFVCENWWWNQIGTPNLLVHVLLIMDDDLTAEQIAKILPIVGRANLDASGARPSGDRIKIAGILAKTLLFNRDVNQFKEVINVIEGEIKFATERGMQYDFSFHHRVDRVNNTLSYGLAYANTFAEWAAYVSETTYKFSANSIRQLVDYYLDGICKMMIFGKYLDPGAMNRDITREGSPETLNATAPEDLMKATDYRRSELGEIVKIRNGVAKPVLSHSTFFWQSEHFTFQRPDFFTSVRMYSTRNSNMEHAHNSEGIMNHHRGDGTNYISRTGDEYYDISPVYDWQKIPGTTVVQKAALPSENEIQKKGLTDFVGAVTDGKYGAVAFDFKSPHDPLEAKKSWFFFDKEYVCLGAGISSESELPVVTTLNQCLLRGEVLVMKVNKKFAVQHGERQFKDARWILHDSIAYVFPKRQKVILSNDSQTGSWYKVNRQADSPKEEVSKDVFKLWIDHGRQPQDASYQYMVVPSVSEQEMSKTDFDHDIKIISNTTAIQAVKHIGLNICEMIFYQPREVQIPGGLKIGIESPGVVMIKTEGNSIKEISVADPARKLDKIRLTINRKIDKSGDNFISSWNKRKGMSKLTIDLPQTVYAGKSVTVDL